MPNEGTCSGCHDPHASELKVDRRGVCHAGIKTVADVATVRTASRSDFDGNGKVEGADAPRMSSSGRSGVFGARTGFHFA